LKIYEILKSCITPGAQKLSTLNLQTPAPPDRIALVADDSRHKPIRTVSFSCVASMGIIATIFNSNKPRLDGFWWLRM